MRCALSLSRSKPTKQVALYWRTQDKRGKEHESDFGIFRVDDLLPLLGA